MPAPDRTAPAPPSRVKVALCQLAVGADKPANIAGAREAILDAARDGAALVVLPEMWNCPYANESFPAYAEVVASVEDWTAPESESESEPDSESASPSIAMLSNAAKETGVVLVGGSIPERCATTGALYNTCCVFSGDGSLVAKHRKTHLFDLDIPGEISFKESDTLTQGESLTVVDTAVGRLGVGICFDVRFPEMASAMANRGAHVLVYPGRSTPSRGRCTGNCCSARARGHAVFRAYVFAREDGGGELSGVGTLHGGGTLRGDLSHGG